MNTKKSLLANLGSWKIPLQMTTYADNSNVIIPFTMQVNYFRVMECILYLVLFSVSAFFMWGVLDKFVSGKTSFSQSKEPTMKFPTITLCFSKHDSTITSYEYELDFVIKYFYWSEDNKTSTFLVTGSNSSVLGKVVHINKLTAAYMGTCYEINRESNGVIGNKFQEFMLYFNRSIPFKDLPLLKIFFSSEKNVYGISFNEWKNGNMAKVNIYKGVYKKIDIIEKKFSYISGITTCGHETFYECFSRKLAAKLNGSSTKCSPGSLPFLPICKEINMSYWPMFWSLWNTVNHDGQCPQSCFTSGYSTEEIYSSTTADARTLKHYYQGLAELKNVIHAWI